ncbi:MAG: protein-L-isoaspartate O-methyltransferase [Burkholderiaceae bacterium]|nr:protein-L-isoaspartate O-methyltransferase [Burkholderiaceae bacterium]
MNIEQARFNMIEQQIRPWDVLDAHVLQLLAVVKREDFVPLAHQALAFVDMEIPLGSMALGQCMLSPKVEARMLQDLNVQKHEKVLEIGTGSGFMAALLAHRAQFVTTLEIDADLAKTASDNLERANVYNAKVVVADGSKELNGSASGPFDVIVLSGSVAQMPTALLQQLKVGGRCMAIVGDEPVMRATLVKRVSDSSFTTQQSWDTLAPRLSGFAETPRFQF